VIGRRGLRLSRGEWAASDASLPPFTDPLNIKR
jgi:hypothetical protein